jgi:hypothetical protein
MRNSVGSLLLGFGLVQLGLYWERSATTTTTYRISYRPRTVSEREGEQDYLQLLLIGEEMVEL